MRSCFVAGMGPITEVKVRSNRGAAVCEWFTYNAEVCSLAAPIYSYRIDVDAVGIMSKLAHVGWADAILLRGGRDHVPPNNSSLALWPAHMRNDMCTIATAFHQSTIHRSLVAKRSCNSNKRCPVVPVSETQRLTTTFIDPGALAQRTYILGHA